MRIPNFIFSLSEIMKFFKRTKFNLRRKAIFEVEHLSTSNSTIRFKLHITNKITLYRAETFSTKEPETLKWIDEFGGRGVFFDIGANIGIYSLYYAKKFQDDVYAFEPSLFNVQLLAKNIWLNNLENQIVLIPNPISNKSIIEFFNLSVLEEGGAHATFKETWNQKGDLLDIKLRYKTLGLSLDHMLENNLIPYPASIKIDVDGIEHIILQGADKVLGSTDLNSVLIEVHSEFNDLKSSVTDSLLKHGFKRVKLEEAYENQIWTR